MDYNPHISLHRRLLALAIADYLEQTGHPLAGYPSKKDGALPVSLQSVLAEHGVHFARATLAKLARLPTIEDTSAPLGSERVAAILATLGYWPPIANSELALRRVPSFYGAVDSAAARTIAEVQGEYVSYQYSSRKPGTILIGRSIIGASMPYGGCLAENYIAKAGSPADSNNSAGIAWADAIGNVYMLMRSLPATSPTFILLDEILRPGTQSAIETINGTAIGAARQYNRHLSAISLHKAPYPDDDSPIEPDQHDRLPDAVRAYILLPLKNGPSNY